MSSSDVDLVLSASLDSFASGLNTAVAKLTGALETMRSDAQRKTSEIDQAFATLGLRRFDDIEKEVDEVRAAFVRLQNAGELTGTALVQAQVRMEEKVRELRAQTNGWAESFDKVKVQAGAAIASVAGVAVVLGRSATAAAEFGEKMAQVGTQLSDTSAIPQLSEQVRELAREMGGDATANAQGLYDILSAGVEDPIDAMERLRVANKLAVGGVTDVTTAAGGLNAAMNSYGDAVGTATDVSDAFFVAAREGATSVAELSNNIGEVAPLAASTGTSFDELIAGVTALTNGGVKTSQAFTQVQSILSAVVKPTKEASDLAAELGIEFDTTAIKSKGLAGFLEDVADKTGGNAEQMAVLFGRVEGLQGALSLTGAQADSFEKTLAALEKKSGETEKAFQQLSETDAFKIREFEAALKDLQLSLGTAVTAFTPVLEVLTDALNYFNELPEPVRVTGAALFGLAAVITPIAIAVAALAGPVKLLAATALPALGTAVKGAAASFTAATAGMTAFGLGAVPLLVTLGAVAVATKLAADALSDYAIAQQEEAQKAKRTEELQAEITARQAQAEALKEYASVAVASAEHVAALGETERAAYLARLEGAKQYQDAVTGVVVRQQELLGNTTAVIQAMSDNSARQRELNDGLKAYADGLALAAQRATSSLSPAVQKISRDLQDASGDADKAQKALKKLFEGLDTGAGRGDIDNLVRGLADVVTGGTQASLVLRDELGGALSKLSGEQLAQFQAAARRAMQAGSEAAEGLAVVADTVLAESLRQLGASAVLIGERFTEGGRAAIGAFQAVAGSGKASAEQVLFAFDAALKRLATPQEIEALLAELRRVGPTAGVSLEQMRKAAADAADATREVKGDTEKLNQEILRSQIRKLEDEFTSLVRGGQATREELQGVVLKLADLNEQLDRVGKDGSAGDRLKDQNKGVGDSFDDVNRSAGGAGDSIEEAGDQADRSSEQLDDADKALRDLDASAQQVQISLGRMSEEFVRAAMDAAGSAKSAKEYIATWNRFNAEYTDQNKLYEARLELANKAIAAHDEEAKALEKLRQQFSALSDQDLKKLLDNERRAKELREGATKATKERAEAERELQNVQRQTQGETQSATRTTVIELRITNQQSGSAEPLRLTQQQLEEITRAVIRNLELAKRAAGQ